MPLADVSLPDAVPTPRITSEDIADLAVLARERIGLVLDDRKAEFLMARLNRRLVGGGFTSYASYRAHLHASPEEQIAFTEALTTHTTSFFRERAQYDWLQATGLPELAARPGAASREVVIWSAACSTGQEGYTALMVADRGRREGHWSLRPRLIGTDLSRQVLRVATQAVYTSQQIEEIPVELRRHVLLSSRRGDGRFRIVPQLRAQADWRQANLVTGVGTEGISADVVFLRNVLIYFDPDSRERVMANVYRRLRPGGYLLTGHTETAFAHSGCLEMVRPSVYRKVGE